MPAIVEFPTIVQETLAQYSDLFANEPERRHFAEYLTGLIVAERKSVRGINSEFVVTTDQSCLNRWMTDVNWDAKRLNERRLKQLQHDPGTRYSAQGVIAIDNTLIDHEGKLIEDAGWFWDHADQRYLIAHDYLIANYVCTSGKHYPLEFRRFRKEEDWDEKDGSFKDHTDLFIELVDWATAQAIPGDFTFDCYFTHEDTLNHIHCKGRTYVGDLKSNRNIIFKGQKMKASEVASSIPPESRKMVEKNGNRQYYFTKTIRIPGVNHPVRIVILWKHRDDTEPIKMVVTNRTRREISRILRVYSKRWTVTETFHRDGKQQLGMGDCQLRDGQGQTRHMYLVFLAYSRIVAQLQQDRAKEWALKRLTTVGEACRAVLRQTLGQTIEWSIQRASEGWTPQQIKASLALP
jgi:hypothetical protein